MPYKDPAKARACKDRWKQRNREFVLAQAREYASRPEVRERSNELRRQWREQNREEQKIRDRAYYQVSKRSQAARKKRYNDRNPDLVKQRCNDYKKRNPDKCQDYIANRRARKLAATGKFTRRQFKILVFIYGGRCVRCHQQKPLTADHIMPLSKGGSNSISNIQCLCRSCNSSKNATHADYRSPTLFCMG